MISDLTNKIKAFRDERDWTQFHNSRNLAAAISVEAGELLDHFIWTDYPRGGDPAVAEEISDIAIYLFELADNLGIDLETAIEQKLATNARKYPVQKAKGCCLKSADL